MAKTPDVRIVGEERYYCERRKVNEGETPRRIAKAYYVDLAVLQELNGWSNDTVLNAGTGYLMPIEKIEPVKYPYELTTDHSQRKDGLDYVLTIEPKMFARDVRINDAKKCENTLDIHEGYSVVAVDIVDTAKKTSVTGNLQPEALEPLYLKSRIAFQKDFEAQCGIGSGTAIPVIQASTKAMTSADMEPVLEVLRLAFAEVRKANLKSSQDNIMSAVEQLKAMVVGEDPATETDEITIDCTAPAFTETLRMGNDLKGRTPADVIREEGVAGIEKLKKQRDYLEKNAEKYPKNKDEVALIDNGLVLAQAILKMGGNAPTTSNTSGKSIRLYGYNADGSLIPKALRGSKIIKGKELRKAYTMTIVWTIGDKYPVRIEICNFYAPLIKLATGAEVPQVSEKQEEVRENFRVSGDRWMEIIGSVTRFVHNFEAEKQPAALAAAMKFSDEAHFAAVAKAEKE